MRQGIMGQLIRHDSGIPDRPGVHISYRLEEHVHILSSILRNYSSDLADGEKTDIERVGRYCL